MNEYILISTTSLWLGILTSISPCPLATNIAAISYIGKKAEHRNIVLLSGLLYALGRVITYVVISFIIVTGLLAVPAISNFLQVHIGKILGPILILTGMFLLGLINIDFNGLGLGHKLHGKVHDLRTISSLLLGILFALSFCPVSAALYFGSLMPVALEQNSRIAIPMIYGIGTAIPVIVFSFIIAFSAHLVGKLFHKISIIEIWMRRITGIIFIFVGIYFSLVYIFGVSI